MVSPLWVDVSSHLHWEVGTTQSMKININSSNIWAIFLWYILWSFILTISEIAAGCMGLNAFFFYSKHITFFEPVLSLFWAFRKVYRLSLGTRALWGPSNMYEASMLRSGCYRHCSWQLVRQRIYPATNSWEMARRNEKKQRKWRR